MASPESGGRAVAIDFSVGESPATARVPRRIRRRLMEGRSSAPSSVEEIEAKLRDAHIRRQQFHEWLASKARPKPRSPSWSSQEEDPGQRLEAKLHAAEQKRLSLLAKAQTRLARLDELRQAAKTSVEMRVKKEREALGTRVESRVQQAEANRMRLRKACMQRRAAVQERKARSSLQRVVRENKYKERVRSAILQKRVAAEKKRMGLLEAEIRRVRARVMQARRVAKSISHQRESERKKLKEQLESRLQRAKRQRAEYLKQRGNHPSSARISWNKNADILSRKLARCWRQFVRLKKTTFDLAKAFETLGINDNAAKSMPYEQLEQCVLSDTAIQTIKALLQRFETRIRSSQPTSSSGPDNIDDLVKRLATPKRRTTPGRTARTRGPARKGSRPKSSVATKLPRYPERVVLCAYMILSQPDAVLSGHGVREAALLESSQNFIQEFESLVTIILRAPRSSNILRQPSAVLSDNLDLHEESTQLLSQRTFRTQLVAFDKAWSSYLYQFVAWKTNDARLMEDYLIRTACQLELSMMQTCKLTADGQTSDLSHDMRAVQKQVAEDQKLLKEKVLSIIGDAGIERMEYALSDTRSKFFETRETGTTVIGPIAHIPSPDTSASSSASSESVPQKHSVDDTGKSKRVVRSLFGTADSMPPNVSTGKQSVDAQSSSTLVKHSSMENELLVNEIVHGGIDTSANANTKDDAESSIKVQIRAAMEKAFWDGIMESLQEADFSRIVGLVKEIRDEFCEIAPQSWKQDIINSIDIDILSQVLESGTLDIDYLGRILEYSLVMLQKLSAAAKEEEMKKVHMKLLSELAGLSQSDDNRNSSSATIKGLRFVLEQIQILKSEVSKARIQLMEPIIRGSTGLEYLQKAFADRYGPTSSAANSIPRTVEWVSSLRANFEEEWSEHMDSLSVLSTNNSLPPASSLRTGSSIPLASKPSSLVASSSGGVEQPECNGEKIDVLVRLGLLKLASGVEGLTADTVPETVKLNALRLRAAQSQFQYISAISTSMFILRQILVSDNSISPPQLQNVLSDSFKRLSQLLDHAPDVGIQEMVDAVVGSSPDGELEGRKEMLTRMLTKSLQKDDPVFMRVSQTIYLAARGVVLGGSGARGRKLADAALRRVGASMHLERLVKAAEELIVVAKVSAHVHGPWYRSLV